ncbi:MAG TPA: amino acid racemase [Candidatus Omnitrophota bacterium]|nr:amino acid racemase [Candidatus Omnitrophota bacterium]
MEKAIGLVGGMGPYAGLDLLKKVYDNVDVHSDQGYPDVMLISASRLIPDRSAYIKNPETENPAVGISYCVRKLADMGATHIGVSCNTAHAPIIMNKVRAFIEREGLSVSLLSIVAETRDHVVRNIKPGRIALFATEGTYRSGIYRDSFCDDPQYEIVEPENDEKQLIWDAIYSKEFGIKSMSSPVQTQAVENFRVVAERMMERDGIDTFIMGCTEIPLGMNRLKLPATLIDPAVILARALVGAVVPEKLKRAQYPAFA